MSYYRDTYLKSEEWKSLRKESFLKSGFRCALCKKRPKKLKGSMAKAFQVHHVKYKNLHDVTTGDLKTVCPDCHLRTHALLRRYPKMKTLPRDVLWQTVVYHLRPESREALSGQVKGVDKSGNSCRQKKEPLAISDPVSVFGNIKKNLFSRGLICKNRMPWREEFNSNLVLVEALSDPDIFLQAYIYETNRDPRRLIPVLYKSELQWLKEVHGK